MKFNLSFLAGVASTLLILVIMSILQDKKTVSIYEDETIVVLYERGMRHIWVNPSIRFDPIDLGAWKHDDAKGAYLSGGTLFYGDGTEIK